MEYFVDENSIVRQIWGKGDTILFIFAGASAEFALNKAVDWLYYTGRLPNDPLGRLFSTVSYARKIVFSEKETALKAIDSIAAIHSAVEANRGKAIPDWAYRDVLFMLIDYSIRSYELLEKELNLTQKQEVFHVFFRVGKRMQLQGLPQDFEAFQKMRQSHLKQNLEAGDYTRDLYRRYRKHLGPLRYRLLLETQIYITPKKVRDLLSLRKLSLLTLLLPPYQISRRIKLDRVLRSLILPAAYRKEINSLDQN
ncbi:oxygenase MpaB family protein [Salegentibacter sediminis]|uniref:oxygenase MpaB family protein n=1 Tax=Salegentibacter sediminis TaxID=1930251 RepID=UPI0009C0B233|nr:oxygenase MpaB family protein [Salegentibacter sediminis]